MGLCISTGVLADLLAEDPEGAEWLEDSLVVANRLLSKAGLPTHSEPTTLANKDSRCGIGSFPYSFLHYLRFAYANAVNDPSWRASPLPPECDPANEEILETESMMLSSHLLCHSDCEGFYFPIDFEDVIFADESDELPGGMLGSSHRLRSELVLVAPALGISLSAAGELEDREANRINALVDAEDGLQRELLSWLALYEACRISIEQKTAIVFN